MAITYGAASTGGGAQNFRVGYEFGGWSAVNSGTTQVVGTIQFYVRNAAAVSNDVQTFNHVYNTVSTAAPAQVQITNTQSVATDRTIGPARTVTYDYSTWGSSPGTFTGSIQGLGSASGAQGFYTGGPCSVTWSIEIPARPGGPPSEPTSVTSTPGDATVSISFGAPSTNDPATTLYQWSNDNSSWGTIATNPFSVSGTNGTAKTVYVRAVNAAGAGPSASATSTPRTVPGAIGFSATPINGNLTIAYSAPSFDGGTAVTSYQYSTNAGSTWTTTPSNPFNVNGPNGTAITVYMRAVNAAGAGPATSVTETPRTTPGAPTSVASTPANGSISVSFGAPSDNGGSAVTGYQYSTDNVTYTAVPSNTSPFSVAGTNGTAITVWVRAVNAAGGGSSGATTNTPRTTPSAPQSFAGSNTTFGQLSLSWAAPSSNGGNAVSSYVLRTGATVLQNTGATSYVHTGLSPYTDYSYTVTAANAAGEGTAASLTVKTMGGVVKIWNSTTSQWVTVLPKVWNGSAWVNAQARIYDGVGATEDAKWKHGI